MYWGSPYTGNGDMGCLIPSTQLCMSSATRSVCLFFFVGFFSHSHAVDPNLAGMGKESEQAPSSFLVGGVTVQSLDPRSGSGDESDAVGVHVGQAAGVVADTADCRASLAGASESDAETDPPLSSEMQSSYYFRYLAQDHDDEEQEEKAFTYSCGFTYLPHPADVKLHSWGRTLTQAFERLGLALFHQMTDIRRVRRRETRRIQAKGSDMESLLFSYLTELLGLYGEENLMASKITVESLDEASFTAIARAEGEKFDRAIHTAGTEVKAVTLHGMRIRQSEIEPGVTTCAPSAGDDVQERCVELSAIVDI